MKASHSQGSNSTSSARILWYVARCREWAPDHSWCEWLRGRGGLPSARRPGSPSSLSVSAARRRQSNRTQSQVMNVAALFNPISNFRIHFETAHSAFPSTRTLSKSVQETPKQRKLTRLLSRHCSKLKSRPLREGVRPLLCSPFTQILPLLCLTNSSVGLSSISSPPRGS
jgi:hypothetical protein